MRGAEGRSGRSRGGGVEGPEREGQTGRGGRGRGRGRCNTHYTTTYMASVND